MTTEELRAFARATDQEINQRMAPITERIEELQAEIDELREHQAETDRLLGIERHGLHDPALDAYAAGDDGVFWQAMADRRVPPAVAKRMVERKGYGRR